MNICMYVCIFFKKSSLSFSKRSRSSREMRTLSAFISSDSILSTHLAQIFQNPWTPIMCPTLSLEIPNAMAISFCLMQRFPQISSLTWSWWSWLLAVTGLPLRVLPLKSGCPNSLSLNRLTQPASYCTHINTLITINSLHSSVNFNWRNLFRG